VLSAYVYTHDCIFPIWGYCKGLTCALSLFLHRQQQASKLGYGRDETPQKPQRKNRTNSKKVLAETRNILILNFNAVSLVVL